MSLSVFYYLRFSLSLSLSRFQPIFVSFAAISAVRCRCFKAMWLVEIYPNHANRASYKGKRLKCLLLKFTMAD